MKIDRVLLPLNNNETYTKFWNVVAPVYKNIFNIHPTLIFLGTEEELKSNNFNENIGDIIRLDKVENISVSYLDWSVTWSIFFGATLFPDDICFTSGIDQIPLSEFFFNKIEKYSEDKYIIGFSDAYKNYNIDTLGYFNTQTNVIWPTSHHVGKGHLFKSIFDIEDSWEQEIKKIYMSKDRYHLGDKLWGLDECYSSEKISVYQNQEVFVKLDLFWEYFHPRRIDNGAPFCIELLKEGYYSEITTKNFNNEKERIETMINLLKPNIK